MRPSALLRRLPLVLAAALAAACGSSSLPEPGEPLAPVERTRPPTLLRCEGNPESVTDGLWFWKSGMVRTDRGHGLEVPAQAVRGKLDDTDFTVERLQSPYLRVRIVSRNETGGYQFRKPARIVFNLAECNVSPEDVARLRVYKLDPDSDAVIEGPLRETWLARDRNSIYATLESLSDYALGIP